MLSLKLMEHAALARGRAWALTSDDDRGDGRQVLGVR